MLAKYLSQCHDRRFCWRSWNCVHFTGGWVELAEGTPLLASYEQATETALSAARYARSLGGLQAAFTKALSREPLPPLAANIGDIVLIEEWRCGSAGTLGICNGVSAITLHPIQGFSSAPMGAASCIWKIRCG